MTPFIFILGFLFMTSIKQTSSGFDSWKKLNRGGGPTKIAANNMALYLIDGEKNLKVIDSDGPMKTVESSINEVDVDGENGLMVIDTNLRMKSRVGVTSSNAIGTSWEAFDGLSTGIATGRYGLIFCWNRYFAYVATGITSSNRRGTSWLPIAFYVKKISCGTTLCFTINNANKLYTSGKIPSGNSPKLLSPALFWAKIGSNVQDISAYSNSTLWKIDSDGIAWEAVNVLDADFLHFNWERPTYQSFNFTNIAVTGKIQYAISTDKHVRVLTGCPIFDFEDGQLANWVGTGDAFSNQPVETQHRFYNQPSGKVGDLYIDTFSPRTNGQMAEGANASIQGNAPTGTLTSPAFQIRTKMLHFVIGGGSPPNNSVGLYVDGEEIFTASGASNDRYNPNGRIRAGRYWWDVSSHVDKCARIKIVDLGTGRFGHTIFDDLCGSPPCFKGMSVTLENFGHEGNVTIGQEITYKIHMKGFYTSKTRPLSINFSFPLLDGEPFAYILKTAISYKCSTSLDKTSERKSIQPNSKRHYTTQQIYKNYMLSDSTLKIIARVYDHSSLTPKVAMGVQSSIRVNFAGKFLQTTKHNINILRHGNETAKVHCSEKITDMGTLYIGDIITYSVELSLLANESRQRAFNVMIKLLLPPYLTLLRVDGQLWYLGDRLLSSSQSHVILRIPELLFEDKRSLKFVIQIGKDFAWERVHFKEMPGILIMDGISYCNKKTCTNANGNGSDIVTLVQPRQYPFTIRRRDVKTERKYTEINVNRGSLIIVCVSCDGTASDGHCYLGNSSTGTWHNILHSVIDILYYDATGPKIFGLLSHERKVELSGDMFKEYKILTDSEWDAVLSRKKSLIVSHIIKDPEKFVRRKSNERLAYQLQCCSND